MSVWAQSLGRFGSPRLHEPGQCEHGHAGLALNRFKGFPGGVETLRLRRLRTGFHADISFYTLKRVVSCSISYRLP